MKSRPRRASPRFFVLGFRVNGPTMKRKATARIIAISLLAAALATTAACGNVEAARGPKRTNVPSPPATSGPTGNAELDAARVAILAALERGDGEAALALVDAAEARFGAEYALAVDRSIALGLLGRGAEALRAAERAVGRAGGVPYPPEATIARLEALLWLGDRSLALREAERATAVHPDDAGLLYELGKAQLALVITSSAIATFTRVLELAPGDYAATLGLVAALSFELKTDEALAALDQLAASHPNDAWIAYEYGIIHQARADEPAAIAALQRAVDLDNAAVTPHAHFQLARIHLDRDELDLARPHLETFIRLAPPHAAAERRYAEEQLTGKRRNK